MIANNQMKGFEKPSLLKDVPTTVSSQASDEQYLRSLASIDNRGWLPGDTVESLKQIIRKQAEKLSVQAEKLSVAEKALKQIAKGREHGWNPCTDCSDEDLAKQALAGIRG